jgi:hypothetical protein
MFCPHLGEDIEKRLVLKQGGNYYYPNREPIPTDTAESVKELVRKFAERSAEEAKKANMTYWQGKTEAPMQMPTNTMIQTNQWEMWSPPEMHYGKEDPDVQSGFGLRRSQRLGDKEKDKFSQLPSKAEETNKSVDNTPKPPPHNQEANKNPVTTRKRRPSYPGAWVEDVSDDNSSDGGEVREEAKPISKEKKEDEKKVKEEGTQELIGQTMDKAKVGGGLRKKILKQSFTLTLEELLLIAPKFLQELNNLLDEEPKMMDCSQNSGKLNRCCFDEDEEQRKGRFHPGLGKPLTYACSLGFVDITINGKIVKGVSGQWGRVEYYARRAFTTVKITHKRDHHEFYWYWWSFFPHSWIGGRNCLSH